MFDPMDLVHPLFLTPKSCLKRFNAVWFTSQPVSRNTLGDITWKLAKAVLELKLK